MADSNIQQARTYFEYTTWDRLTNDQKSFVNFVMRNGCIYFRGEYEGNTLLHMAGCLRLDSRVSNDYGDYSRVGYIVDVMAPYTKYGESEENAFALMHLTEEGRNSIPGYGDDDDTIQEWYGSTNETHYEDGIIDCNTVLCTAETNLCIYIVHSLSDDNMYIPFLHEASVGTNGGSGDNVEDIQLRIPVKIYTKIVRSNAENEDRLVLPADIKDKIPNDTTRLYAFESKIDPSSCVNNPIDYKLRTESFTIESNGASNSFYYKVGMLPLNQKASDDYVDALEIANDLKEEHLHLMVRNIDNANCVAFNLYDSSSQVSGFSADYKSRSGEPEEPMFVESVVGSYKRDGLAKSFVLPLCKYKGCIYGLAYFRLFDSNDNEADNVYNITAVKQSDESVSDLQLQFNLID